MVGKYLCDNLSISYNIYTSSRTCSDYNFDLTNEDSIFEIKDKIRIDTIIILSAIKNKENNYDPDSNLIAIKKILDFSVKSNVKNIIFFSTFFLFDKNIKNNYIFMKAMSENYIEQFSNYNGLNSIILRLPRLYGDTFQSLDSQPFIKKILRDLNLNSKINLYSENKIYRNFLSFHDLLKLVKKLNNNFKTSKLAISGQRIELKKFIDVSKKILKSSSSIEVIKNKINIINDIEITKKNTKNFEIINYNLDKDMYTLSSYIDFNE